MMAAAAAAAAALSGGNAAAAATPGSAAAAAAAPHSVSDDEAASQDVASSSSASRKVVRFRIDADQDKVHYSAHITMHYNHPTLCHAAMLSTAASLLQSQLKHRLLALLHPVYELFLCILTQC
jgi:predicted outer membrane protein